MPDARALLEALERLLPGHAADDMDQAHVADNPYVGLAAFQRVDADRFFGRERDIVQLTNRLRHHRMVTLTGASGAGKSSLVRAGVIPALERSGQSWESFIVRPSRRPLAALAEVLAQGWRPPGQDATLYGSESSAAGREHLETTLREQPGYLGTILRARSRERRCRILLFVDQFEELYTLGADRMTRTAFVACIEGVADDASSPLRVVISVRADFLDRVAEDRAFTSELTRSLILLSPLSREQLRAALVKPLEVAGGYAFESESLVDTMLDSLTATRSPLPLLQFTAAQLWQSCHGSSEHITRESYEALGGVEGALAVHADAVLTGLSRNEQRIARAVFTSLVSDERTRAVVGMDELRESVQRDARDELERVVGHLAETRLVIVETVRDAGTTVELTHESLIECWATLKTWLDEDIESAAFRRQLGAAARHWDERGRSDDLLWRGQTADDARRWQQRADMALSDLGERDRDYLHAVIDMAARSRRRRRWLVGLTMAFLGTVAVTVSLLAVRAERKAAEAARNAAAARWSAAEARNATRLASASQHMADPTLVLALVREMEPTPTLSPKWRELARWATFQDIALAIFTHQDAVTSVAYSPDGTRILTASRDGMVRVWDADDSGEPLHLVGHQNYVASAAFSPDGTRIVTASTDGTARVWNADGSGVPLRLEGHADYVVSAAFSPDGTRIVTASWDATARVWNADGRGEPLRLEGHEDYVVSAAFSPDGTRIVTASTDGTARVWNADSSSVLLVLHGHQDGIASAAYSPDGTRIVTASRDRTARVWNADGTGVPVLLQGHHDPVWSAAFSPDGTRVVTASRDTTVRVWNADGTGTPLVLEGHQDGVMHVAFSPDGTRVVTASWDTTARVWNTDGSGKPVRLEAHQDYVVAAAFSPDGTRIVTASWDKTARVWNVDDTAVPIRLSGHRSGVVSADFSPDGTRVVTASWDTTARVWNADGTGEPLRLEGHENYVVAAGFSPDGTRVVTASADGTARVWNADGTGEPVRLEGHGDVVTSAGFSPDGTRIVTASWDGTARLWNADGSGDPVLLEGHQDYVMSAAFRPDGRSILTISGDRTARVWNAEEPFIGTAPPAILRMQDVDAYTARFSPDGTRIVTTSHNKPDPARGKTRYGAMVWPAFEPFSGLDDPELWLATTYCPPVELRVELLGLSEGLARERFARCRARVRASRCSRHGC